MSELSIIMTRILTLHGFPLAPTPQYLLYLSSKPLFLFCFLLSDIWRASSLLGTFAMFAIIIQKL